MKRFLILSLIGAYALNSSIAFSAPPTSTSSNNSGTNSTGGAGAVANSNSNVGSGNNGTGTGNSGSGNLGVNGTSTGNASGSSSTTGELAPETTSTGGVQGGSTGGAGAVANTNSNVGSGNEGTGIGNSGSGNQGNESSTGNAGGTNGRTTGETTGQTTGETTGQTTGETTGETNGASTGEPETRKIGFKVNFIPLIYADFVKTRSVINLTPASSLASYLYSFDRTLQSYQGAGCETQQEIPMQAQCGRFDFDRPISLEIDNFSSAGFKVIDYYDFIVGAGGAANFSLVNAATVGSLFNATVGLMPMGGKSLRIERFVKNVKDTVQSQTELRRAKFPYTVDSLYENFNVGDNAEVASTGGVLAFASAGFAGFQLGVNYLFSGTWKTSVELVDYNTAFVKVSKVKVHTIAGSAGVGVFTVAAAKFRNMDDSFSFMLDLSKKENVTIYKDLVRGHLIPAQKAALKSTSGVAIVSAYKAKTLGRKKVAYVGLPIFINKTWQSGVAETSVESLEKDGKNYLVHLGSYFNNSSYRRINKTDDKIETFVGQVVEQVGSNSKKYLSAQFAWGFATTDLWMPRMNYELNKFYKFSGLKNAFGVVVPNVKDLGNLSASVQLDIPHEGIVNLLSLPKGTLVQFGSEVVKEYFADGDESQLCVAHPTSRVCRRVWRNKTKNSLQKAEEILLDMRSETNTDKFAKRFALLGKEMLDNQFSFQTILRSTCNPATFNVTVEGKRVSRVVKTTVLENPCY